MTETPLDATPHSGSIRRPRSTAQLRGIELGIGQR